MKLSFSVALAGALLPSIAFAASPTITNPVGAVSSFPEFLDVLLTIFMFIATPVLVVALIWGGFLLVSAQGDEKKIADGKRVIIWTIVATFIIVGARAIYALLQGTIKPFIDAV